MTTTQHSNQLLEELVAEEISIQIDQIAEGLQREGWPIAMVKRFMHVPWSACRNNSSGRLGATTHLHRAVALLTTGIATIR